MITTSSQQRPQRELGLYLLYPSSLSMHVMERLASAWETYISSIISFLSAFPPFYLWKARSMGEWWVYSFPVFIHAGLTKLFLKIHSLESCLASALKVIA